MKVRQSNFELLRILAMLAIVIGHLHMTADATGVAPPAAACFANLLGNAPRLAVNVFLMIGVWFMVDRPFSARRICGLYLTTVLYSVPLTLLMLFAGVVVPAVDVVRGLLPFWGRGFWFISAYIVLMSFAPFLARTFRLSRRAQMLLLTLLLLFLTVNSTLPVPQSSYVCDLFWFMAVFLFIGFVRHETRWTERGNAWGSLLLGLMLYVGLFLMYWYGKSHATGAGVAIERLAYQWLWDMKTLPNLLSAFLIFLGFARLDVGCRPWINRLAAGTLGVYVIHAVPAFHAWLFLQVFQLRAWIGFPWSPVGLLLVGLVIFAGCSMIDAVRRRWISPLYENSRWFGGLCRRLDALYASCGLAEPAK